MIDGFDLLPVSEFLLDDASITRFRTRYRDLFGAVATGDPLYQSISEGRRLAGMEHWLPLLEGLQKLLTGMPVNLAILTGRDKGKMRESTLMGLADGSINNLEIRQLLAKWSNGTLLPEDGEKLSHAIETNREARMLYLDAQHYSAYLHADELRCGDDSTSRN